MKLNLTPFYDLVDKKYLSVQKHPTADLLVWNYTQKCQFDRHWTTETMMARGLITDSAGEVKARPFKKFFNYEEHMGEDSKLPKLPLKENFEVFDKVDGSLGILYFLPDGTPQIATRGSFISEQAIEANKILADTIAKFGIKLLPEMPYTWLFEIIYPENRIVVNYGTTRNLVLLAIIEKETGEELPITSLITPLSKVKKFDGLTDFNQIKTFIRPNAEGFVIRFESGVRCKLKYDEYVRLHRLVTGVNRKTIWELLKNNQPFDKLLNQVPEEFYEWVRSTKKGLEDKFVVIETLMLQDYEKVRNLKTRKEQAEAVKDSKYASIIFRLIDQNLYQDLIWKVLKPKAAKPYKEDIDTK